MAYFYMCDRANLFMKENKFYTHSTFFIPIIYILVLGVFYNENTKEVRVVFFFTSCYLYLITNSRLKIVSFIRPEYTSMLYRRGQMNIVAVLHLVDSVAVLKQFGGSSKSFVKIVEKLENNDL